MKKTALLLTAVMAAILLSSGVALAATITCQAEVDCFGTKKADAIRGTDGDDQIYARGGGDTLKGFDGEDILYGQGGNDKLLGGLGADQIVGGSGQDTLSGGALFDLFSFGPGWGQDSIINGADSIKDGVSFRGALTGDAAPVSEDLTIYLVAGDGPEVTNANGTNTVDWDTGAISEVQGGDGNDTITGNGAGNRISGWQGSDTIASGGGDDEIYVVGGGIDHVNCGSNFIFPDHDIVFYDSLDSVADNCETPILKNP